MLFNRLNKKSYANTDLIQSILRPYFRYANSNGLEGYFEEKLSKARHPRTRKRLLLEKKKIALDLKKFWHLWRNGEPIPESCICAVQKIGSWAIARYHRRHPKWQTAFNHRGIMTTAQMLDEANTKQQFIKLVDC